MMRRISGRSVRSCTTAKGWGLTTDGEYLYMSDGSDKIYVRDAENFGVVRTLQVTAKGRPVDMLNELEWIEGASGPIFYLYDQVVVIDPQTGEVTGVVDFEGLQEPSWTGRRKRMFSTVSLTMPHRETSM